MSEPDHTGNDESPDTTDGAASAPDDAPQDSSPLTTDDESQRDDGVVRPGNTPD